jgi:hypothetical protein
MTCGNIDPLVAGGAGVASSAHHPTVILSEVSRRFFFRVRF